MQSQQVINTRRWNIYIACVAVPGFVLIVMSIIVGFSSLTKVEVNVDPNTLYVSSATLIGLATFGSVLGIKLGKDPTSQKWNYLGIGVISVSVMMVIILQWLTMIYACCMHLNSWAFVIWQFGTLIYLMGIIAGFAFVLEPSLSLKSVDSATSSLQS